MLPSLVPRRATPLVVLALLLAVASATLVSAQELPLVPDAPAPIPGRLLDDAPGPVSVDVMWLGPSDGSVFSVGMNTHSVDLDGYDLSQLAVLRTAQGLEVKPTGWEAPRGGHHRSGSLIFLTVLEDGTPVDLTGGFVVVIRDVGGVAERTFAWDPS